MRIKEWHTILVGDRPVNHDLEPVVYRKGKTNVRIEGMWYCPECDDVVDMKRLTSQGFDRRPRGLHGRYTSMFQKGLWFTKRSRLSDEEEQKINIDEYTMLSEPVEEIIDDIESNFLTKEKYPGTARNARCPCGSGKKYKRCCGANI